MTKFKQLVCSHSKKGNKKTCYNNDSLIKMKELWNRRHPDKPILEKEPIKIWSCLKDNMRGICDTEYCWLKQKFMKNNLTNELTHYTFAPIAPTSWKKNINEWLSSVDIENVMKQYEKKYPNFVFIGPSPIDFDKHLMYGECVWEELCKFELSKYIANEKNKVGIIFNIDPHYKDGSHWISMFVDVKNSFIFFFDSTGDKCPKEVKKLIDRIIEQGNQLDIKLTYCENKKEHQHKDTECGIYSIYCLTELLAENLTVDDFSKKRISDKDMEELRNVFFNV